MVSAAEFFSKKGFDTHTYSLQGNIKGAVKCESLKEAAENSSVVVLPLPFSADGINVFAPSSHSIKTDELLSYLSKNTLITGGRLSKEFTDKALSLGFKTFDYFKSERLTILNAIPTAEGALAIAINETKRTIFASKCAVLGYGRIGKILARLLKSLGAEVYVFARSGQALTWAQAEGCIPIPFDHISCALKDTDIIFNTIPAPVLTEKVLKNTKENVLIIDLASAPGGVELEAAKRLSKKVIFALSLPGKVAPETAGEIIAQCVLSYTEGGLL